MTRRNDTVTAPPIDWEAPFHEVLRAWIQSEGLTHPAAAARLHIPVGAVRRWLYRTEGKECPYPEAFKRLMKIRD